MLSKKKIFEINFVDSNWLAVEKHLDYVISKNKKELWLTINPEFVEKTCKDQELKKIVKKTLNFPDGIGIILAGVILRKPLAARFPGIDLISIFKDRKVYLLGAQAVVVKKAAEKLKNQGLNIRGYRHGYFKAAEVPLVIKEINRAKAEILLVGLGMPKQEKWLAENFEKLKINVGLTIGGSFDVISGNKKRASQMFRSLGLEWLFRLFQEPGRFRRQLILIKYFFRVVLFKLLGK